MADVNIYPVIMCGGSGTRLWPASRPSKPKQFIPLIDDVSLFEMTVDRVANIHGFERLIIITGENQCSFISQQLGKWTGRTDVLIEPRGRNSAPAIALAALHVAEIDPKGILVVVACDHYIPDADFFCSEIAVAVEEAAIGGIVTLGIEPTWPSTAYGYIAPNEGPKRVKPVREFVEKPDLETAKEYLTSGYSWNSGNFIVSAPTLIDEFRTNAPGILDKVSQARDGSYALAEGERLGDAFLEVESISFDYAIMEKSKQTKVLCTDLVWSDLGAWDAVYAVSDKDANGNAISKTDIAVDAKDNLIVSSGPSVALLGVDGLSVIAQEDMILVSPLNRSQDLKSVVSVLEENNRPELDFPVEKFDPIRARETMKKWLLNAAMPLWWSNGFDVESKTWRESLAADTALPTGQDRRARVQGRQAFSAVAAGQLGWAGPWKSAALQTLEGVEQHYTRSDGLLRTVVSDDLECVDDSALLYDQTFVLLALASLNPAMPEATDKALALLDRIETTFTHTAPEGSGLDFAGFTSGTDPKFQSNPHMHLFEATLAWVECTTGETRDRWFALADAIVKLACEKMIDTDEGYIGEFFDASWNLLQGEAGDLIEPGHQFEWAWLLCRWALISDQPQLREIALRLFENGFSGLDKGRKVVFTQLNTKRKPLSDQARFWPQTEWFKAACILKRTTADSEEQAYFKTQIKWAHHAISLYLDTPINGLWLDKMRKDGTFEDEPVPASTFYHIICAIQEFEKFEV